MGIARLTEPAAPLVAVADIGATILADYPYLVLSLVLFAIFMVVFARTRRHRSLLIFSGLGSAAFSFSSFVFVPEYWDPVRVWSLVVGPEDLVFSFANGGIVWYLATWRRRVLPADDRSVAAFVARFLGWSLLGVASSIPPHLAGFAPMTCCFFSMAVVGTALLISRPDLRMLAATGALGFSTLYTAIGVMTMITFPSFTTQWTHENLCGLAVLGLPLEETAWAFGFGAIFPLIVASSAKIRVT
ncbi:MAG: lycopene cyclase domain-containing protein [Candidatus Sulfomarinibacteraceae bacterium]